MGDWRQQSRHVRAEGQKPHLRREVELNMCGAALHGGQDVWRWCASDGMDLLYLVHLIGAGEQREQTDDLYAIQ